jgi:hypothetical protein
MRSTPAGAWTGWWLGTTPLVCATASLETDHAAGKADATVSRNG